MQTEIDKSLKEGGQDSHKRKEIKRLQQKLNSTNHEIGQMESSQ